MRRARPSSGWPVSRTTDVACSTASCALPRPMVFASTPAAASANSMPVRQVEIARHARRIDLQPFREAAGFRQRARGEAEQARHRAPFGVPRAGRPLMRGDHRAAAWSATCPGAAAAAERMIVAETGLRLCGMADGSAASRHVRLGHFRHFGGGEACHVARHLAERADEDRQPARGVGHRGAARVPGDGAARRGRSSAAKASRTAGPCSPIAASVPTGPPSEAPRTFARTLALARGGLRDARQPDRGLEAERDRRCVLPIGAPRARRRAVRLRHRDQAGENGRQILVQQLEGVAHLQHQRGIERCPASSRPCGTRLPAPPAGASARPSRRGSSGRRPARSPLPARRDRGCVGIDRLDGCGQRLAAQVPARACARARAASVRSIAASRARSENTARIRSVAKSGPVRPESSDEKAMSAPETPCAGRHCSSSSGNRPDCIRTPV